MLDNVMLVIASTNEPVLVTVTGIGALALLGGRTPKASELGRYA